MEKYALAHALYTLSQKVEHTRGGPDCIPTSGSQIEHSNNSHNCRQSSLASPVEASFLMVRNAGCVCATSQQVLFRNILQRVKSLGPLLTLLGGFPLIEYGGNRPPIELQTPFGLSVTS